MLVRVISENILAESDLSEVANHGYLWLLDEKRTSRHGAPDDPLKWYRSIATGREHPWFDSEVEEAHG